MYGLVKLQYSKVVPLRRAGAKEKRQYSSYIFFISTL
jgi:hypothetical protein